jgi:hypothetical protein
MQLAFSGSDLLYQVPDAKLKGRSWTIEALVLPVEQLVQVFGTGLNCMCGFAEGVRVDRSAGPRVAAVPPTTPAV